MDHLGPEHESQRLDVEGLYRRRLLRDGADQCLDRQGLAVAGHAVEDDVALPGDVEPLVRRPAVKEALDILLQLRLSARVEYDVVPGGVLYALPQALAFGPFRIVIHPDLIVELARPLAGC